MCSRCRDFVRKGNFASFMVKNAKTGCTCEKECDRLIQGICHDCGHYVQQR